MSRKSISFDIETFATHAFAPIRSIGAVAFYEEDQNTFDELLKDSFYVNVFSPSYAMMGVDHIFWKDKKTEQFWAEQPVEAQNAFLDPAPLPITLALANFADWVKMNLGSKGHAWANPPSFDMTIVNQHFHHFGIELPYHYRQSKDLRTLNHVGNFVSKASIELDPSFIKVVKHNALHDAAYQAGVIQQNFRKIRNG